MIQPVEDEAPGAVSVGLKPRGPCAHRRGKIGLKKLVALDDMGVGVDRAV